MNYESFKTVVNNLVRKAGGGISVRFSYSGGKYVARAENVLITGNPISTKVTVRWNGRNHQGMTDFA